MAAVLTRNFLDMHVKVYVFLSYNQSAKAPTEDFTMNETLKGKWSFRSFRHDPIVVKDGHVAGEPELAKTWTPPGTLIVETGERGDVKGTLTFHLPRPPGAEVSLTITGSITPATAEDPAFVELIGESPPTAPRPAVYEVKGVFVPGSDHVVGTVLSMANDLAGKPVGTAGAFALFPAKA